jgi:hypothetical protein
MTLVCSWTETMYIPEGTRTTKDPIVSRTYSCANCQIPMDVDYCPKHEVALVENKRAYAEWGTISPSGGLADVVRWTAYQCSEPGCTYTQVHGGRPPA